MVIPSSAYAIQSSNAETYGAGQWDVIYSGNINVTSSGSYTPVVTSGGGDIRLCVQGIDPGNYVSFQFYAPTGAILPGMFYNNSSSTASPYSCFAKRDARPYVDSSGKAYFYVKAVGINRGDSVYMVIED